MKAIDVHVHPSTAEYHRHMGDYLAETEKYFRIKVTMRTDEEMANEFRQEDVKGVLLALDTESASGLPRVTNDYVAAVVKKYPDAFIGGFASVDPWKGKMAVAELERAVKELGLIGAKFQQAMQAFYPNDRRFYPLWEKCVELKIPVLFHCGTTGFGAGMPGGGGVKLKYVKPIPYIDDLAADFPELTIICAHPAWPWQEEMIAVAVHKANVYIDLSGWSPKYFPPTLVREINSRLQDKALFGTDYPFITPARWLKDFEQLELKPGVKEKILLTNAQKVLGLT